MQFMTQNDKFTLIGFFFDNQKKYTSAFLQV